MNIRSKLNPIRAVKELGESEEGSKSKEFDPIIASITMAATTLVQLSLRIPNYQQVEHKPFSLPLRPLYASTAIHRSPCFSNLAIKTPQIPQRLSFRSRIFNCMATLKPHVTTTATTTVSSTTISVSMALALAAVISGSILRAAQVMAERISLARINPRLLQELAALQSIKGSEVLCHTGSLFFAVVSSSGRVVHTPLTVVAAGMVKWLELYSGVLTVRIMLSWFPNIPWDRQPLSAIRDMCDPYLNLFRNIVPPIRNALDVSPILAFIVLGTLMSVLRVGVVPRS